jgi:hypothetical protein
MSRNTTSGIKSAIDSSASTPFEAEPTKSRAGVPLEQAHHVLVRDLLVIDHEATDQLNGSSDRHGQRIEVRKRNSEQCFIAIVQMQTLSSAWPSR